MNNVVAEAVPGQDLPATEPVAKTAKPAKAVTAPKAPKAAAKAAKKAVAKQPAPASAPKPAKAKTAKTAKPVKPAKPAKPVKAAKPAAPVRTEKTARADKPDKLVRDSFTIPRGEYALLQELKTRAATLGRPARKSEVLRAGIQALKALDDAALLAVLGTVPVIKTGRPTGS